MDRQLSHLVNPGSLACDLVCNHLACQVHPLTSSRRCPWAHHLAQEGILEPLLRGCLVDPVASPLWHHPLEPKGPYDPHPHQLWGPHHLSELGLSHHLQWGASLLDLAHLALHPDLSHRSLLLWGVREDPEEWGPQFKQDPPHQLMPWSRHHQGQSHLEPCHLGL